MWRGLAAATGCAALVTVAIAWPVILSPTERIFGDEIVGRHHDPFTVMRQMAGAGVSGPYRQPVTDDVGWAIARVLPPVAAYNVIVLVTFPLTAAAAYALARYMLVPHVGSLIAAIFFTFAPLKLAHAAYHPHVAQTHWLPLYLLALFAAIDRPSLLRMAGLGGAAIGLALSNFYGGLVGAVLTPVAIAAYWMASPRRPTLRGPVIVATCCTIAGMVAIASIRVVYPALAADPIAFGFPASAVAEHSAQWWAYLTPSVLHPLFSLGSAGAFARRGVTQALVEQQVYVSYALAVLAAIGIVAALTAWRRGSTRQSVFALVVIAASAFVISLGPLDGACTQESWAIACRLHDVAPMFRAYARFAFVVHLGVALAAGSGVAWLVSGRAQGPAPTLSADTAREQGPAPTLSADTAPPQGPAPANAAAHWGDHKRRRAGRIVAIALVAVAIFEYWPLPARTRDVLPTEGHRWVANQPGDIHLLDCVPATSAESNVGWLMNQPVSALGPQVATCRDPFLGVKLAAQGYTHAIVRRADRAQAAPLLDRTGSGVSAVADFPSGRVYAVTATAPPVVVLGDRGFFEYEHDADGTWRWMGREARWQVTNTTDSLITVVLSLTLESVHTPRLLAVAVDDGALERVHVGVRASSYLLGPWSLAPGGHSVTFGAHGAPFQPSATGVSRDMRELTIAFHDVSWTVVEDTTPPAP